MSRLELHEYRLKKFMEVGKITRKEAFRPPAEANPDR